jgi:hypothetical protein
MFGSTLDASVMRWASRLTRALQDRDKEIKKNYVVRGDGDTIDVKGRIRVNSDTTTPDSVETDREGEIRYNKATGIFQGYDGTAWRDFH